MNHFNIREPIQHFREAKKKLSPNNHTSFNSLFHFFSLAQKFSVKTFTSERRSHAESFFQATTLRTREWEDDKKVFHVVECQQMLNEQIPEHKSRDNVIKTSESIAREEQSSAQVSRLFNNAVDSYSVESSDYED